MRKRIAALLIAVIATVAAVIPCYAYQLDESEIAAGAYYLYNIENSAVLAQKNADVAISPSSTVKMMTACVVLESGIDLSNVVTVTREMLATSSGRAMGLTTGDRLTLEDLLFATVCGGYNDASLVLALSVCESVGDFVGLMNAKAQELGMESTVYVNPTGIEESGMTTTAGDIAALAMHLSQNERFIEIGATKSYTLSSDATCSRKTITNRSSLLASYRGMSNFNTGSGNGDHTVLYYKSGGLTYICVVMSAATVSGDAIEGSCAEVLSKRLLAHATNDYSVRTLISASSVIDTVPLKYSVELSEIDLYLEKDLGVYLSNEISTEGDLVYSRYLYDDLSAPLKAGQQVGELVVSLDGRIIAVGAIVVRESVERNSFLYFMDLMKGYLTSRSFLITLVSFVLIMLAYYLIKRRRLEKMYNKMSRAARRAPKRGGNGGERR